MIQTKYYQRLNLRGATGWLAVPWCDTQLLVMLACKRPLPQTSESESQKGKQAGTQFMWGGTTGKQQQRRNQSVPEPRPPWSVRGHVDQITGQTRAAWRLVTCECVCVCVCCIRNLSIDATTGRALRPRPAAVFTHCQLLPLSSGDTAGYFLL